MGRARRRSAVVLIELPCLAVLEIQKILPPLGIRKTCSGPPRDRRPRQRYSDEGPIGGTIET
jgi:hypothetical protein